MADYESHETHSLRLALVERDVGGMKSAVAEIRDSTKEIAASLQILTTLQQMHSQMQTDVLRAFINIKDHEDRIRLVENDMPTVRLARGWVITAVVGVIGLIGVGMLSLILRP